MLQTTSSFDVFYPYAIDPTRHFYIFAILLVTAKSRNGSNFGAALTWGFNGAVLFANELNSGYRFGALHATFEPLVRVYP